MPLSKGLFSFLFCFIFIFCTNNPTLGQNYIFAQLSGTPMNTTGWNLQGDARVTNVTGAGNSELLVCSVTGASGAAFFNQPINLTQCNKWIAEFDFRLYDGTGADGLAFCFLDTPPSGFITGGGLGIPNTANGLKVCFDTWNNCIPFDTSTVHQDMPKVEIRWGKGYNVNTDPPNFIVGECINEPTRINSDGKLSYMRSPEYNHAKITYDSGNIKVFVNDTLYLTGYQQFNFPGYLGFTASTGGYSDNHSIKNVIIYTQMPHSYSWYPSTGLSDTTVSAPLLHIPGNSASAQLYTYYVKTSFKSNPGCASEDSVAIKVYPNPTVNFITPEICLTDAIAQFYDSSYTLDSTTLPFLYQWNFGDPNAQAGNPNSSTEKNPSHHYSAASKYFLTLAVTNSDGCADSLSKIFTVNGAIPVASFSMNNAPVLCSNQSVIIKNESSVDFGSITKVQIYWGDSATISYTDDQPFTGKLYSHNYPNPVSANLLNYKIQMISFSGITCESEFDQQITVQPSPHVQFSSIPSLCDYDSALMITQASELTSLPGSFTYSGDEISTDGLFNPQKAGAGKYKILYKYISSEGCMDSAYQTITVFAPPEVNAGNDTSIVINQPLQLHAISSDIISDSFLWSPATGLNNPGIADPIAALVSTIDELRYMVKATDTAGCYGEAYIDVKVFKTAPDIFVPNAFTPGNAVNNIFKPIPVGISSMSFFRIYNRWGQLVFSTSRLGDGWDGTLSGRPQETGSYVWMVQGTTYRGNTIFKKGTVTLIR
jgi:gliding motility-associated-like protein